MRNKLDDLTDQKFNRWTVMRCVGRKNRRLHWECRCDCGTVKEVEHRSIVIGASKSCGCLATERASEAHRKHGHTVNNLGKPDPSRTYTTWAGMKARCLNPNDHNFPSWGGRGITVCERWLDFDGFYEDMGDKPEGMTLGRIDNNGPYSKENCRWETTKDQANNRRNNTFFEHEGQRRTIAQWADEKGVSQYTLARRMSMGWTTERALLDFDGRKVGRYTAFGETKTLKEWSQDARCAITYSSLKQRVRKGWDLTEAITTPKMT